MEPHLHATDRLTDRQRTPFPEKPESPSALQGTDIEAAPRSVDALQTAMQKIGQAVYAQAGSGSENGTDGQAGGQGEPRKEGTVEGEFREV